MVAAACVDYDAMLLLLLQVPATEYFASKNDFIIPTLGKKRQPTNQVDD